MASITRADVEHVADLARLHLTDEEIDRMQSQLSNILEAIETLRDVDTSHVGPTASVIQLENVMREDVARPGLERDAALANAPLRDDPFLRVPTVLETGRGPTCRWPTGPSRTPPRRFGPGRSPRGS
jgi:aspartyl-tRNA(Asn)/glutamyl-tRNA(Gln) amidotransferase subunit C